MNRHLATGIGLGVLVVGLGGFLLASRGVPPKASREPGTLQAVATENFWGSLLAQLAGPHARVISIVSDPNADPHEYESSAGTAREFADADYVVINGAGYDTWSARLLAASVNPHRKVLDVARLLGKQAGDNPHFWYDPTDVNQVVARMEQDLSALDPAHAAYYRQRHQTLQSALTQYQDRLAAIKRQFAGTKVAATEDIFAYLAQAAGLNLISPPAFMQAVAEGNEPPAQSIIAFQDQLKRREPAVLVYNQQTVTPLTRSMEQLAKEEGLPVVGITETVQPPDALFQDWMNSEVVSLQNALSARAPELQTHAQR